MKIREIRKSDDSFLWDMLYEMAYFPNENEKPDKKDLLSEPGISKYLNNFGTAASDIGFVAVNENGQPIGTAWFRLFDSEAKSYGYISDDIPELGIAILEEYRGKGVGSKLINALIERAKSQGYPALSLSVDARNPALKLYERVGFKKVGVSGTSWTMKLDL